MKIKYKKQQFQEDAARAVVNVFAGQPRYIHKYIIDPGRGAQLPGAQLPMAEEGWGNHQIVIGRDAIRDHVQEIQHRSMIKPIDELQRRKTYTYIKTMEELYRAYGWSKFIVVVPSIAIREGVNKSFQMTEEHFAEEYGKKVRHFIYNSAQPTQIEQFASDSGINCMIINTQTDWGFGGLAGLPNGILPPT